jgi:hypothetical protein
LINNDRVSRYFKVEEVRRFYADLQDVLSIHYHYWLQRGTFEVNRNRLRLAEPYLGRALVMGGDDLRVHVEYALLLYRKALSGEWPTEAGSFAREARSKLEDLVAKYGSQNPYPYHVLIKQETAWLEMSISDPQARYGELLNLRLIANEALRHHSHDAMIRRVAKDLERAFLDLAVAAPGKPHRRRSERRQKSHRKRPK